MADNQTAEVKIKLDVVGDAPQQTKKLSENLRQAAAAQTALQRIKNAAHRETFASPAGRRLIEDGYRERVEAIRLAQGRQAVEQRAALQMQRDDLASGVTLKEARQAAVMRRDQEQVQRARARVEARVQREYVGSPAHVAELRERARDAARADRDRLRVQHAETLARHGHLGTAALAVRRAAAPAAGVALAAAGRVAGMATSGAQGTVELNRWNYQMQRLNRELANAFAPALDMATGLLSRFNEALKNIGPLGQDLLAFGTITTLAMSKISSFSRDMTGKGPGELMKKWFADQEGKVTKGSLMQGSAITTAIAATLFAVQSRQNKHKIAGEFGIDEGLTDLALKYTSIINPFANRFHELYDKRKKSTLTPAGTSFGELGSGYDRLTLATAEIDGAKREPPKSTEKWLEEICGILKDVVGDVMKAGEAPIFKSSPFVPGASGFNSAFGK